MLRPSLLLLALFTSVQAQAASLAKDAEPATRAAQAAVLERLPFADRGAFADARRGFIAALPDALVPGSDGQPAWSMAPYAFLASDKAPATVNPSLWRQAQLNAIHGLFEVAEGIYQVRGMDLANMTIVEGEQGLIVIDPLFTPATARAALDLYLAHRPAKPVAAVIYTHSHIDHFGGVKGVVDEAQVAAGAVRVYAPEGFMAHAVSENVIAGNAMSRRATYMYGTRLTPGERGHVDTGLGKTLSGGEQTLIPPTDSIGENGVQTIAGVEIEFHMASGSEAPAELMLYFPAQRVLNTAEVTSQHMHNIYTLRGAEVRDASRWSRYIDEVRERFGERTDVLIAQHHWPVWGGERSREFLAVQRDMYKYVHDQSVRLMNHGYRPGEIAETLQLPASLDQEWAARGYYGTLKHNSRAIYQKYLGWYDANPANLDPLPPVDAAKRYVALAGGVDKLVASAQQAYDAGDFRWAAELLKHAVYAEPSNKPAKDLMARSFEQMGYMAESSAWRNAYLTGALELRQGPPEKGMARDALLDMLQHTPIERFLEAMAASLNGPKAGDKNLAVNLVFSDLGESYVLRIANGVLHFRKAPPATDANATLTLTKAFFLRMVTGGAGAKDLLLSDDTRIEGSKLDLGRFFALIEKAPGTFPIVTR